MIPIATVLARAGAVGVALVGLANPGPARADTAFESEIACAKSRTFDATACRRAFVAARAEFEARTRTYPSRFACYRAFGPCMPWPLHTRTPTMFRPQWMGVSLRRSGSGIVALAMIAPGKLRLAIQPRAVSQAADADVASLAAPSGRATGDVRSLCGLIETVAAREHLPPSFLTRLLWQESSFRTEVVSSAGAQGIAQFMPQTAEERGLDNPFDPEKAVRTSGALLADLSRRFGNLGLAAAAYNGGPARVTGWLNGARTLPPETRNYVQRITGRSVEDWAKPGRAGDSADRQPATSCAQVAGQLARRD